MRHLTLLRVTLALATPLVASCRPIESLRESVRQTPHERYAEQLRLTGLDATALGRDWLAASDSVLRIAPAVALPFRESTFIAAEEPGATAYRFQARRGMRVSIDVEVQSEPGTRIFIDLFEVRDTVRPPNRIGSADDEARTLQHEVRRDGELLLRLQPELLRTARFTVTVQSDASLAFPVGGRDGRAVQSFFGAARDGGRRVHHGVDIFAPRGTPVLAASGGIATVTTSQLGGNVVWVRDIQRGMSVYYAHLDSQIVRSGAIVRAGDTLGLVGNSGNARGTAPHLHFGIYSRGEGPVDPLPFIHAPRVQPAAIAADTARLGEWVRVARSATSLRNSPATGAEVIRAMPTLTSARALGAAAGWYRVRLPDGATGYVLATAVERADRAVRSERPSMAAAVHERPLRDAAIVDSARAGVALPVLGRFANHLLVRTTTGRAGWLLGD